MLQLKNVVFKVSGSASDTKQLSERTIINDVSFTFERGGFYAITGPNGSGKSTLAKLIMGINPITRGKIIFNGTDIGKYSIDERSNAGIVYGFQHPARFKEIGRASCRERV